MSVWSPRAGLRGGALAGSSVAVSQRQGSRLEHHRHAADASGKVGRGTTHQGGRSSVGWRGAAGVAAFRRRRAALEGGEDSGVNL
jgi:hypothetical protein